MVWLLESRPGLVRNKELSVNSTVFLEITLDNRLQLGPHISTGSCSQGRWTHPSYGWCLQGKTAQPTKGPSPCTSLSSGGIPVPVPVFCSGRWRPPLRGGGGLSGRIMLLNARPIAENEPRMTLLCAAGVNLRGGVTPDGGSMIGASIFYAKNDDSSETPPSLADEMNKVIHAHSPEVEQISKQLQSTQNMDSEKNSLSSMVWICASTQTRGMVMVRLCSLFLKAILTMFAMSIEVGTTCCDTTTLVPGISPLVIHLFSIVHILIIEVSFLLIRGGEAKNSGITAQFAR
ncbi:hypothetical protein EVAR_100805_1 [Eumeta japonica]|uniref:Uncharacterized protein n=1 Tax=Eumeta variegata TaxID=151549 RepID=A0A4C2A4M5_EUMVA|nr:hypothetical protein EVAR_100805_1 [Eumeta japonica]